MNRYGRDKGPNSPFRIIVMILLIIFVGPAVVSVVGSVIIGIFSISLVLLVLALVLLASPILILAFPESLGLNVPQAALFFFGIAILSLFVLSVAVVIKITKWIVMAVINLIRRLLGNL